MFMVMPWKMMMAMDGESSLAELLAVGETLPTVVRVVRWRCHLACDP